MRKYNVRMRVLQSNRSKPKETFRADLMKWHSTVRERLVRMSAGSEAYYAKWGRVLHSQRFNVDRSRMHYVLDSKKNMKLLNREISLKKHA